jgi:hypothetical protein
MVYLKNRNLGIFWEGLEMEDVGIFYGHCVYSAAKWYIYFMAIWYIWWSFGTFGIFSPVLVS